MRLRNGKIIRANASGIQSAEEARATLLAPARATKALDETSANAFGRGLSGVFARWTALQLAVVNDWGGGGSDEKARAAEEEVLTWFLSRKRKDELELEDLLVEILGDDFNVCCEDNSPAEVAKLAWAMYEQCAEGNYAMVEQIQATPLPRESIERSKRVEEDKRWTMNGGGDMDVGDTSSDDENSSGGEGMDADGLADQLGEAFNVRPNGDDSELRSSRSSRAPVIDDDGWTTIPTRR